MDINIRTASSMDLNDLVRLVGGFRDHLGRTEPTDSSLKVTIPPVLASKDALFLLVSDGPGTCLGYALLRFRFSMWLSRQEAFIEDLYVVEDARSNGVGRALAERCIAEAKARGCAEINLDTQEANEAAISLYESLGFTNTQGAVHGRQLWFELRI